MPRARVIPSKMDEEYPGQWFQDVEYNLARLEAQLARFDVLFNEVIITSEIWGNLVSTKQTLSSLRLALDPHRIDVI